jgi:hypothetical protein
MTRRARRAEAAVRVRRPEPVELHALGDVRQAVRELLDDNMIENRGTAQRPRLHPRPDTERNPSRETDD